MYLGPYELYNFDIWPTKKNQQVTHMEYNNSWNRRYYLMYVCGIITIQLIIRLRMNNRITFPIQIQINFKW